MELLERDTFLGSLAGYADEALLGQGRVVLLAGEAGVGKTALVEALQADLGVLRLPREPDRQTLKRGPSIDGPMEAT